MQHGHAHGISLVAELLSVRHPAHEPLMKLLSATGNPEAGKTSSPEERIAGVGMAIAEIRKYDPQPGSASSVVLRILDEVDNGEKKRIMDKCDWYAGIRPWDPPVTPAVVSTPLIPDDE